MITPVEIVSPKDASTVILMRTVDDGSWELFLARRHRLQSFMAGAFVFPGGQMDPSDYGPDLSSVILASNSFKPQDLLQETGLTPDIARGLFIAAIRETFEEAGVLLAGDRSGNFLSFSQDTLARFAAYRRDLNSACISFADIIRKESCFLFPEALIPFSHWITPVTEPKRFDTRFFLARLPSGQDSVCDCPELTDFLWVAPQDALKMHFSREIILMPPTLKTIMELAKFSSIDELFEAAKKRILYPILPQIFDQGSKLPHDPEYGIDQYRRPADPDDPCRFIKEDGLWRAVCCGDIKKP
ncbi:MAG: NUDIX hydrolase [Smithellaceae bacterium]